MCLRRLVKACNASLVHEPPRASCWGSLDRGFGNRGFRVTWKMFDRDAKTLLSDPRTQAFAWAQGTFPRFRKPLCPKALIREYRSCVSLDLQCHTAVCRTETLPCEAWTSTTSTRRKESFTKPAREWSFLCPFDMWCVIVAVMFRRPMSCLQLQITRFTRVYPVRMFSHSSLRTDKVSSYAQSP